MTLHDPSELLARPTVDLVELPLASFRPLLLAESLPDDEALAALDLVLRLRVFRTLARASDVEALRAEYDDLQRLVPHRREADLNAAPRFWATRWKTLANLVETAAEASVVRDPEKARRLAHSAEILRAVEADAGLSQTELGERVKLQPANLTRILAVLEANGLIERRAVGREKQVFPVRPSAPTTKSAPASVPRRTAIYLTLWAAAVGG